jgi:hypothetical protein
MITILNGHTSPETALVVNDYPYGFRLRCKIRYWIEANKRKGMRFVSQTTNPKVPGEVWNKPKASTYTGFMVMYRDEQGHIQHDALHLCDGPEAHCRFKGYAEQLTPDQQKLLAHYETISRQVNPMSWAAWDVMHAPQPA